MIFKQANLDQGLKTYPYIIITRRRQLKMNTPYYEAYVAFTTPSSVQGTWKDKQSELESQYVMHMLSYLHEVLGTKTY